MIKRQLYSMKNIDRMVQDKRERELRLNYKKQMESVYDKKTG